MSANYTHLNDDSTSPAATTVRTSTDHTPLLGESEENEEDVPVEEDDKGTATATSAVVNLANTILGTGMLAQPAAIASLGLLLGALMIGFAGFTSALGLYFLSRCASRTPPRQSSFNAVAKLTFPHAAVLFDIAIAVKCFGVSISYLIIIGDLMPKVVQILSPNGDIGDVALFLLDRRFWITVFMAVIIPLSFLKKLDSLRYTSMIALVAVVYLLFIVVFYFFDPSSPSPPPGSVRLINLSTDFFTNLPVFIFAFTCHQNIFSIYNELRDQSQKHVSKVITTSIGSSMAIYEVIGILGYLSFGHDVGPNIIAMYPPSIFVNIGRLAIVILVLFSYPLQLHPCRACLEKVIAVCVPSGQEAEPVPTEEDEDDVVKPHPKPRSNTIFITLTVGILISSYIISMLVSKLDLVLSFVGATGSTTISFILPGLFYAKMFRDEAKFEEGKKAQWERVKVYTAIALSLYGVSVLIVSNVFNVLRVLDGEL